MVAVSLQVRKVGFVHPLANDGQSREAAGLDGRGENPRAAGTASVRLPASSVEPVYGLSPTLLVAKSSGSYPDPDRPAPRHEQHWTTFQYDRTRLPVRLPGQHLHPQLRRPSWEGSSSRAGSSA